MSNQLPLETLFELSEENATIGQLRDFSATMDRLLMTTSINMQSLGILIVEANVVKPMIGHLVNDLASYTQNLLMLKDLIDEALIRRAKQNNSTKDETT